MKQYYRIKVLHKLQLQNCHEKPVHNCLYGCLHENNLLHKTQSGFRTQHSCGTALVHMIDSWLNALDCGKMVGVVLVNFKKLLI